MQKIIANVILAVSLFLSIFFGLNADNVTATVDGQVTTETQEITVTVKNGTRGTIGLSDYFTVDAVEQKLDGKWISISYTGPVPDVGIVLYPTLKTDYTVHLNSYGIDSLSVGEYRFVIPYSCDGHRTAYAYFNVTE